MAIEMPMTGKSLNVAEKIMREKAANELIFPSLLQVLRRNTSQWLDGAMCGDVGRCALECVWVSILC
jgi:hypothetical protein